MKIFSKDNLCPDHGFQTGYLPGTNLKHYHLRKLTRKKESFINKLFIHSRYVHTCIYTHIKHTYITYYAL